MKKDKLFAPFLTLFACALCLLFMLYFGRNLKDILIALLIVLLIFYTIGYLIQSRINKFVKENEELEEKRAAEEGAVIEKEASEDENIESEENRESSLPPLTGAMPKRPGEEDDGFGM